MTDENPNQPASNPNVTIVERRGGGGGLLIGFAILIVVAVAAYFLVIQNKSANTKDAAITSAAKSVGDTADKAGAAIDDAKK